MKYIRTPKSIKFCEIKKTNNSLSSSQYKKLMIDIEKCEKLAWFLKTKLSNKHKGDEIGSSNYYKQSSHYFIRTSCLNEYNFIPEFTSESEIPMNPKSFLGNGLKKGDIILSKDSNIGECAMVNKDYPNHMLSGAIYNLPIKEKYSFYVLALLKHTCFREQLDTLVPKGATIRHAKKLFLECYIPIPNDKELYEISTLCEQIFKKESLIKDRFSETIRIIEQEILNNQNDVEYDFKYPQYRNLLEIKRFDTGLYNERYKEIENLIKNYKHGYSNIKELELELKRGQNLQISQIGKSIYSNEYYKNFYTLILPKYLSKYGTVNVISYLGNENKLQTLEKGDIIFGAEGFEKGRSLVVVSEMSKTITNIHGITIKQKEHNLEKGIFVKQILDFYRNCGIIDMMAVGGNGGSFAQRYWDIIKFPNFPKNVIQEMTKLYHNSTMTKYVLKNSIDKDFVAYDNDYNNIAGIYDLDYSMKYLKHILNDKIDDMLIKNKKFK